MSNLSRDYEAILILHPELGEEEISKLKTQFAELIARSGGQVNDASNLGKRKLSYRIKKLSEGIYLQVRFQIPPEQIMGLKKATSLLERVARFAVFKKSPGEVVAAGAEGKSELLPAE